jgi:predicted RNA-binding protein (virulence factor B family)
MLKLGEYNQLKVLRDTSSGLFLGDEEGNEVLLPGKFIPEGTQVNDSIQVFIYKDKDERMIATNQQPKILLHQYAFLEAKMVNRTGAFMDWGLDKDLFVPYSEQPRRMYEGNFYVVYLYIDQETERLTASANVNRFLKKKALTVEEGEEVELLVYDRGDLGYSVIINHLHSGLVYFNEVFGELKIGTVCQGFIKKIREDNKIDVALQRPGYHNIGNFVQIIHQKLQANQGFLALTDDSSPEEIYQMLNMSKKNFKKSIGTLYKKRQIRIEKNGIYLVENKSS